MTAPAAIPLYIGYKWIIPVKLTNATTGAPLDISTWAIRGDLWLPGQGVSQATAYDAQDVNVAQASFKFIVPKSVTSTIASQPASSTNFACRIMVNYTDGGGDPIALRPIFILPLSPRDSTL